MNVLPEELKILILSHVKYQFIEQVQLVNKEIYQLCHDQRLWNQLVKRTFPFYSNNSLDAKKSYLHFYKYFDEYTLKIISKFIKYRTKFTDLQQVYEQIFTLLVKHITGLFNIAKIINKEEYEKYCEQLTLTTINKIFTALTIPIVITANILKGNGLRDVPEVIHSRQLLKIITSMMKDYKDPV